MLHFVTSPVLMFMLILVLFSVSSTSWIQRVQPLNVLVSTPKVGPESWNITARQYLNASLFSLVMEPDCNLVTYNGSTPYLTTNLSAMMRADGSAGPVGPPDSRNCYATVQADGNFVVYQNLNAIHRIPLWASNTFSKAFSTSTYMYWILGRDGSFRVYEPDGAVLTTLERLFIPVNGSRGRDAPAMSNVHFPPELEWKPKMAVDGYPYMPAGYFLSPGSKLQTLNGRFVLLFGQDCKLQSRKAGRENDTAYDRSVIWDPQRSMTSGSAVPSGNCELRLQEDGRLEIRDNVSGVVHWTTGVSGDDDAVNWVLKLSAEDGHVSVNDIMDPSAILWTSVEGDVKVSRSGAKLWPIVVGVVGGVFFTAMASFWLFWHFYFRLSFRNPTEKAFQRRLRSIGGRSQVLSEAKITQATNNFGCRIGYGGFGDVFYGKLEDGQEIAAKVLSSGSHQSQEEFYNEIELLSMVHYKYLVTLIGYSFTSQHQILVYEFMSGGDLRNRLSQGNQCGDNGVAESPLSWRERTSITLQVAEGIEYLHEKCTPAIIHRDIKSNNILLTNDLVAKVADFGLSKLRRIDQGNATHVTTVVKGTPGYLDPQYHKTGLLTEKSDVYAFGIVLMEILTGQQQMHIAERVFEARRSENVEVLVDPLLRGEYDRDEFVCLVDLSLWCVRKMSGNRPFMRQVVQRLRETVVAPLESSALPKVLVQSKLGDDHKQDIVVELENAKDVAGSDIATPFSGFCTGDIRSGTWPVDQFGDSRFSQMLDHSSSQSSAGNPEVSEFNP